MSQNKILNDGDLVKYNKRQFDLDAIGLKLGQLYMVKRLMATDLLVIEVSQGRMLTLVDRGQFTDHADGFTKHQCPVVLPIGNQSNG